MTRIGVPSGVTEVSCLNDPSFVRSDTLIVVVPCVTLGPFSDEQLAMNSASVPAKVSPVSAMPVRFKNSRRPTDVSREKVFCSIVVYDDTNPRDRCSNMSNVSRRRNSHFWWEQWEFCAYSDYGRVRLPREATDPLSPRDLGNRACSACP